MSLRVLSLLLLALTLFWSGFTTTEQAAPVLAAEAMQSGDRTTGESPLQRDDAALVDHSVDPVSPPMQAEGVMDLPGLFLARPEAPAVALTMVRPDAYPTSAWLAPCLDGPLRPPRSLA